MRERAINLISNTLEKNAACDENTDRQTQIAICYIVLHPLVNEAVAPEAARNLKELFERARRELWGLKEKRFGERPGPFARKQCDNPTTAKVQRASDSHSLSDIPPYEGNRGGPAADARSPSTYHAVVSFYMLSYQLSEGDDSEVIAEATSAQLLQRTAIRVPSRTIDSIEDFITTDLLPDVCHPGRYVRRPTDWLRLAACNSPLFTERLASLRDEAGSRRDISDDLEVAYSGHVHLVELLLNFSTSDPLVNAAVGMGRP
ncbi:hypothetical protein V8E54_004435 [Elaphomyces granulatus]